MTASDDRRDGAWGRRWPDVGGGAVLVAAPAWPPVVVTVRCDPGVAEVPAVTPEWDDDRARFSLRSGGHITIGRSPASVDLVVPRPLPGECVVQPHLASAAAALATWDGAEALHGGAFVHGGRAWALIGDKGAGKSTALAQLALAGCPVVADDLTICAGGRVPIGPRCVDLREEPAARLGAGRPLGVVGSRERWRVDLPDGEATVPFGGLVELAWGPPGVRDLPLADRLRLILGNRALPLPPRASAATLELAAHRAVTWSRPRSWDDTTGAIQVLLADLGRP